MNWKIMFTIWVSLLPIVADLFNDRLTKIQFHYNENPQKDLTVSEGINSQDLIKSEIVTIQGKEIYYEVYGDGSPLFLLHGYSMSSESWRPYVSDYCKDYTVYLVDLPGHGKSDSFKNDLSIKGVAEDLNYLVDYLKIKKISAIGFSFGGDVLYQLALLNPPLIESMITIGAVGSWDVNNFKEYSEGFTFENRENFPWLKTHSSDDQIKELMNQFKNYTVALTDSELQQIDSKVLVVIGDDDEGIDLVEVSRVRKYLPNSDLWVLPNVSHGAHEGKNKDEFVLKSKSFFSKQ